MMKSYASLAVLVALCVSLAAAQSFGTPQELSFSGGNTNAVASGTISNTTDPRPAFFVQLAAWEGVYATIQQPYEANRLVLYYDRNAVTTSSETVLNTQTSGTVRVNEDGSSNAQNGAFMKIGSGLDSLGDLGILSASPGRAYFGVRVLGSGTNIPYRLQVWKYNARLTFDNRTNDVPEAEVCCGATFPFLIEPTITKDGKLSNVTQFYVLNDPRGFQGFSVSGVVIRVGKIATQLNYVSRNVPETPTDRTTCTSYTVVDPAVTHSFAAVGTSSDTNTYFRLMYNEGPCPADASYGAGLFPAHVAAYAVSVLAILVSVLVLV